MTNLAGVRRSAAAALVGLLLASCAHRDPAQVVLHDADRAMGGSELKTLRYAASGTGASFGQAFQPGMAWPRVRLSSYSRLIDYENAAMREDSASRRLEPTGGGGLPAMGAGERASTGFVRGAHAWNMGGAAPAAAPEAVAGRQHELWITPHGILKAGMRNAATLAKEGTRNVVTFTEPGRFSASVWISPEGLVERVDSIAPDPVLGDTATVTLYSDYRSFGAVRFPGRIRQNMGGFMVLDLEVKEVQANAAVTIEVPAPVQSFAEQVVVERPAPGVWFLTGGSHNSVLVEMADHLILVESPLSDARAKAVIAQARQLVPDKPIRYAINSHHHFDHSGGLRAAAAEGITLVASEQARPWFERVLANPNRIQPDLLAASGRKAAVTGVNGQRSFADAGRTVEVFMIEESPHAQGFMLVWLPAEQLLIEADAYSPGPRNAAPPAVPDASDVNLVMNIERLQLNPERILPLHGRMVQASEFYTAAGRR